MLAVLIQTLQILNVSVFGLWEETGEPMRVVRYATKRVIPFLLTSLHGCILSKISETHLLRRTRRAQCLLLATVLISTLTETTINESGEAVISMAKTVS